MKNDMIFKYKGEKNFRVTIKQVFNHCASVRGTSFLYSFVDYCRSILGNSYLINNREINPLTWSIVGTAHIIDTKIESRPEYITPLGCIDTNDFYLLNLHNVLMYDRLCIAPKTILGYWMFNQFMNKI